MKLDKIYEDVKIGKRRMDAVRKRLKKKNAQFRKLTKAEQRVQIAKDVIQQLELKKLLATSTYLTPIAEIAIGGYSWGTDVRKLDVSEVTSQVQCQVCGIGSLFVTAVERHDKLKVTNFVGKADDDRWDNRDSQVKYLRKWFPSAMLDEVESYFEVGSGFNGSSSPIKRQASAEKRLKMIMENIISNKGKFDPDKGEHRHDDGGLY